mgnify:CR=1 FL=1
MINEIKRCTKQELKKLKASDYLDGDVVIVEDRYYIYIRYSNNEGRKYDTPLLLSYVELGNGKKIDCTPGSSKGFTPYYIHDFLGRF